jgi:hypothetical protein
MQKFHINPNFLIRGFSIIKEQKTWIFFLKNPTTFIQLLREEKIEKKDDAKENTKKKKEKEESYLNVSCEWTWEHEKKTKIH